MTIKSILSKKLPIVLRATLLFVVLALSFGPSKVSAGITPVGNNPTTYTWTNTTTIHVDNYDNTAYGGQTAFDFSCSGAFGSLDCEAPGSAQKQVCNQKITVGSDVTQGQLVGALYSQSVPGGCLRAAPSGITIVDPNHTAPTDPAKQQSSNNAQLNYACTGNSSACVCPSDGTQPNCGLDPVLLRCPTRTQCNVVTQYLNPFIKFLGILAGIAVTIGIIVGGIQYSASGGDPQKVASAKKHIRNSILALLVYFFLYAFLKFIIPGGDTITG